MVECACAGKVGARIPALTQIRFRGLQPKYNTSFASFPSNYRNSHDGAPHFPRAPKGTLMLNVIMLGSVSSVFSSLTANYGHSRAKTHVHDEISCSIKLLFPHSWKVRFDGIILPRFVPHVATLIPSAAFTTRIVFLQFVLWFMGQVSSAEGSIRESPQTLNAHGCTI